MFSVLLSFLALRSATVTDLTKDTFFSFTSSEVGIAVVHFYGKNCDACTAAEDTFEELSRMYYQEPRMRFGQLDCDRATDVCDSSGVNSRPAWLVWLPGQSHSKQYNRNVDTDSFEKWLRQQTGIWPPARRDNLLYTNKSDIDPLLRKSGCVFAVIDSPRLDASQPLHNASRALERKVRRGVRFVAIDEAENSVLSKKLLGSQKFGAFLWAKPTAAARADWVQYTGPADPDNIRDFLNEKKCAVAVATPTPTPEPLPELPDLDEFVEEENDEPSPAERAEAFRKQKGTNTEDAELEKPQKPKTAPVESEGDDDVPEWSDDDDNI
jgi:hypothetical protein